MSGEVGRAFPRFRRLAFCAGASLAGLLCFASAPAAASCPNEALRAGASSELPDCRAYELVTPADAGLRPTAANFNEILGAFSSQLISPDPAHGSVIFQTVGGALSGSEGTGNTDRYQAVRGPAGWSTHLIGPTAAQTEQPVPGGITPDHGFYFLTQGSSSAPDYGSLNIGESAGRGAVYLHLPDGSFELVGIGRLGEAPFVEPDYIAPGGSHVIFRSGTQAGSPAIKLEPQAPEDGISAIYDRTPGGPTRVVSLLPGEVTPSTESSFEGSSADGSVILFANEGTLYARVDGTQTYLVTGGEWTPAGVSANGSRVFYAKEGNLFVFDTETQLTTPITTSSDAQFVNVSADGSHVYFVSPSQLAPPLGSAGASNLYLWDAGDEQVRFVAALAESDVSGPMSLTNWTSEAATPSMSSTHGPANDPSRSTPDGTKLVFQSRAQLTSFDNAGYSEVYRYEEGSEPLVCVSCVGPGPAQSDAALQSVWAGSQDPVTPLPPPYPVANLSEEGDIVFFQSSDRLTPNDHDSRQDVYEWRNGTVSLISGGQSSLNDYLYAASGDGQDVLFLTNDHLLGSDRSQAGALYDARVDGGFAEDLGTSEPCVGEACQGEPGSAPSSSPLASETFVASAPKHQARKCKHGQRRRGGKCRHKKRHKRNRHHRGSSK